MGRSDKVTLWLGDTFLSCFLLFPTMVFYWRGIWDLVGVYIFPDDELKRCWTIVGMGSATIFGYALHPIMDVTLRQTSQRWRLVWTRVYMAVYAVLPMAYWRGVWTTADYYLHQYGWQGALLEYVVCEVLLLVGRVRQTAIFPPLFVSMDTRNDLLQPSTRFSTKPGVSWEYTLDAIFSQFYALTLTILLWRGAWVTIDACLAHYDYLASHVVSMVVGYCATLIVLLLDPLFLYIHRILSQKDDDSLSRCRLLTILGWEGLVYILAFWAHFFLWRGAWVLNTIYVIADPEMGGWLNYILGSVGFLGMQVYSFVGACGCVVDGNMDESTDRFFPTKYLSKILPHCRRKKDSAIPQQNLINPDSTSPNPTQEISSDDNPRSAEANQNLI